MAPTKVFCALIEVRILDGCEFDPDDNAGAAVRCYIPAQDSQLAGERLGAELVKMKMELVETEWCVDYDNTVWDNPEDPIESRLVAEVRETGDVLFVSAL